jgi:hypothetical protein
MLNETKSPIKVGVDHSLESPGFHSVSTDAGFAMENVSAEQRSIGLPSLWRNITFYLIGLLLLFTAIAKLSMLMTDSFADVRVGLPKGILWTSVVIELWLAEFIEPRAS